MRDNSTFEERHGMTREQMRQQVSQRSREKLVNDKQQERRDLLLLGRELRQEYQQT